MHWYERVVEENSWELKYRKILFLRIFFSKTIHINTFSMNFIQFTKIKKKRK